MRSRPIHVHRSIRNPVLIFTVTFLITIFYEIELLPKKWDSCSCKVQLEKTRSWKVFNAVLRYQTFSNFIFSNFITNSKVSNFSFFQLPFPTTCIQFFPLRFHQLEHGKRSFERLHKSI